MRLIDRKSHAKSRTPGEGCFLGWCLSSRKVTHIFPHQPWLQCWSVRTVLRDDGRVIVARIATDQTMRSGVAALVDVLQLAGVNANAMLPAELATS
jgi:hypothetical protein